jgi:DNA gyrase subunit A
VAASKYIDLDQGETVLCLATGHSEVVALGTAQGLVKRVDLSATPLKSGQNIITLQPGDALVGAHPAGDRSWLTFITSDAQLLRFEASAVRPQGPAASGMTGLKLADGSRVICFSAVTTPEEARVVTVSASLDTLVGSGAQRVKVTAFDDFPAKGRATQGVRAHAFLKGEDILTAAWAGTAPRASALDGKAVELPADLTKRDASGIPAAGDISFLGAPFAAN